MTFHIMLGEYSATASGGEDALWRWCEMTSRPNCERDIKEFHRLRATLSDQDKREAEQAWLREYHGQ